MSKPTPTADQLRIDIYTLLNITPYNMVWEDGIERFKRVPYQNIVNVIELLKAHKHQTNIMPNETVDTILTTGYDTAPSIESFLALTLSRKEQTTFSGFVVHPDDAGETICIDEVHTTHHVTPTESNDMIAFIQKAYMPDEYDSDGQNVNMWWYI